MLNKELLMTLTPTEEKGIFLLTVGSWTDKYRENHFGYVASEGGALSSALDYFVEGTNSERFDHLPSSVYHSFTVTRLAFPDNHKPNRTETRVYMHIKYSDGSIESGTFYFDLNKLASSVFDGSANKFSGIRKDSGKTLRIYLGPSETPPHISKRFLKRGSLC